MRQLPPSLEKFLLSLGINTNRLMWKLHYWEEAWNQWRRAKPNPERRYKQCRFCSSLALAEDKVCKCGRKLPSYLMYRATRALAIEKPEFTIVSILFLSLILGLFAWQVMLDFPHAILSPTIKYDGYGGFTGVGVDFGALNAIFLQRGEYWRLLGFGLAHFGVLHVFFNSTAIMQMLPRFEEEIGAWRTLILLTVTQLGAAAGAMIESPYSIVAGASGIAFGLMGFGLAYSYRQGRRMETSFYWRWLIYGIAFTFLVPFISKGGHIGGLLAGLPLGFLMAGRPPNGVVKIIYQVAGVICLLLWLACLIFLTGSVLHIGTPR
ncbi:MAG: rhomboid family intramembrane serine protease [Candidatus Sumerlaeota bacterium]|nr:rhomboid family intramembrane serine protease [Candidatus Sumerlaeota bacterium]